MDKVQNSNYIKNLLRKINEADNVSYTIDMLQKQRNVVSVIFIITFIMALILSVIVISSSNKEIIIPSLDPERSMIYDSRHISSSYYTELGLDIIHLLLDISPDTLSHQYKRLQMHFLPEARQGLISTLNDIKKDVTDKKLSTIFDPDIEQIKVIPSKNQVLIPGTLKTFTYNTVTSAEKKVYQLSFSYYRNRIYVADIKEIEQEQK